MPPDVPLCSQFLSISPRQPLICFLSEVSCKQNNTVYSFVVCLASFTQPDAFDIPPRCWIYVSVVCSCLLMYYNVCFFDDQYVKHPFMSLSAIHLYIFFWELSLNLFLLILKVGLFVIIEFLSHIFLGISGSDDLGRRQRQEG